MRFLVLGAGMMGRAVAYDLATVEPRHEVTLADIDIDAATRAAAAIGTPVAPLQLDVNDAGALRTALQNCDGAVSAVSYSVNEQVTRACIEAGVSLCDLGGNDEVVRRQMVLDAEAKKAGVTIAPNCGLAPGLINILAVSGTRAFDTLEAIHLRVGGLPQHPRPPLNYQIVFSAEGLLNEYLEPALVIRDGVLTATESMTDLEEIAFPPPFGRLEAFITSGGASLLAGMFQHRVRTLDYKTIRYPGHCEKFRMLLDLGFAGTEPLVLGSTVRTHREFFTELLRKKLDFGDTDVVLARAIIRGTARGRRKELAYEWIDSYDEKTGMTAMMRTTAFPTAVIARMIAGNRCAVRGVMPPELFVPGDTVIQELARRHIQITRRVTEDTQ